MDVEDQEWKDFCADLDKAKARRANTPHDWNIVKGFLNGATHIFVERDRVLATKPSIRRDIVIQGKVAKSIRHYLADGKLPPKRGRNGPALHWRMPPKDALWTGDD